MPAYGNQMLGGATPGLSKLAAAIAGGQGAYDQGADAEAGRLTKMQQALAAIQASRAQANAHNSVAAQNDAETGVLTGRPAALDESVALGTGTTLPMINAVRQFVQTGQRPMRDLQGPPTDEGVGPGQAPVVDDATQSKIMQALSRTVAMRTNLKDTTPESLAKATGEYQNQDQEAAAAGNPAMTQALGQLRYASKGNAPYTQNAEGSVLNSLFGTVDQSNPIAVAHVGLTGAKTNAEKALAVDRYASAGAHNANAAKLKDETNGGTDGFSPAAIENAAARYNMDGTLPPMGMGKSGSAGRQAILNRAAELSIGVDPKDLRIGQIDAKNASAALQQLGKSKTMNAAFEKTANANAELALGLSNKLDRTGIPLLNAGLQAWRTGTGSPEATQFAAANETFVSEYAKIMSGGMGNGPVSDAARTKASKLLTTAMTGGDKGQYASNVKLLQTEMQNRMKGFDDQETELRGKMRGGASTPAAPAAPAAPAGGKTVTRTGMSHGRKVVQYSDGTVNYAD